MNNISPILPPPPISEPSSQHDIFSSRHFAENMEKRRNGRDRYDNSRMLGALDNAVEDTVRTIRCKRSILAARTGLTESCRKMKSFNQSILFDFTGCGSHHLAVAVQPRPGIVSRNRSRDNCGRKSTKRYRRYSVNPFQR